MSKLTTLEKLGRNPFDHDIVFEFIPEEDKKSFLVWVNVYCSVDGNIIATYRAPFEETVYIQMSEYNLKLKAKQREEKINKIID